jgi:solute carrier family 25 phosphate transporter 3
MAAPTALPQLTKSKPEGIDLYARFALAGALGCSITHGAFTPVDVYVSSIDFRLSSSFTTGIN